MQKKSLPQHNETPKPLSNNQTCGKQGTRPYRRTHFFIVLALAQRRNSYTL